MKIKTSPTFVSSTYKLYIIKINKYTNNNNSNLHKRIQQKDNQTINTHPKNNNTHSQRDWALIISYQTIKLLIKYSIHNNKVVRR